jgi:hypothetical protein
MTAPVVLREFLITYGSCQIASVAAAGGGNTVYTMSADQPTDWMEANVPVTIFGCSNAVNNGTFRVVSLAGTALTVDNSAGVVEAGSPGEVAIPIGGTSEYHLHDKIRHSDEYPTESFHFSAVIMETSETVFNALIRAIDRAFRTPRQRLRVVQNGVVVHDRNPNNESGGNTGFNAEPSIDRPESDWNTGRSRQWDISVRLSRPADLAGQSGRQSTTNDLNLDAANIKSVAISGVYTALGANDARTQYGAAADTYCAAVLATLGGTFEKVSDVASTDDANKICNFRREYLELIYNQSPGLLDHPAIKRGSYSYRRNQTAPGDSQSDVRRLEGLTASFFCEVDRLVTTGLNGLWKSTISPYISSQVRSIMNSNDAAMVSKDVDVNQKSNTISGEVNYLVVAEGSSDILEIDIVKEVDWDKGKVLLGAWDGNPFAKHVFQGLASRARVTTVRYLLLGDKEEWEELADGRWYSGGNYQVMNDKAATRRRFIGLPPEQIQCTEVVRVIFEEYVETPASATSVAPGTQT